MSLNFHTMFCVYMICGFWCLSAYFKGWVIDWEILPKLITIKKNLLGETHCSCRWSKLYWERIPLRRNMVGEMFHPKTSEKWFMLESSLGSPRVGVRSRMLRPEMLWLVPAVTWLNVDGFKILVKIPWQFAAVFSASRHCIQLKLTSIVSFFILLPINQHYVDKNQSMELPKYHNAWSVFASHTTLGDVMDFQLLLTSLSCRLVNTNESRQLQTLNWKPRWNCWATLKP